MHRLLHGIRQALQSPSRTTRTAVVLGRLLGAAFLLCFATGLYSHFLQNPLPWMTFPTRPTWLYQLTQGVHITAGLVCLPLILGKLYAVYPELFRTPPITGLRSLLERASIALLVAASLVEIAIGLLNTYQWYRLFPFPFRQTHFALSFVIIGSLAIHIAVKLDLIALHWRRPAAGVEAAAPAPAAAVGAVTPAAAGAATRAPARRGDAGRGVTGRVFAWIDRTPAPRSPRVSRRGFLTTIGVASATLVALTAGQSFRPLDALTVFAPRKPGVGPGGLPVNRTAAAARVTETARAGDWALTVMAGGSSRALSLADLRSLPQHTVSLPIACVEGWSQLAEWQGVRVKDLLALVGSPASVRVRVRSLEQGSLYAMSELEPEFVRDDLTLIALRLNGHVLDLDHGYPARLIAPARPGVLQTKWLSTVEVIG
ncbi:molybdopterin-dependent oxidoreductase [Galbitalea soli]|uniref:Molybdopterin-dependent oxidoreductase n=2 Tax=Galbitalea soli TaxID=1268042 RepID=A0A7C9TQ56_9MICO|nr:molybdopterin-dependent oxidoreductase [Galbitalea soli]